MRKTKTCREEILQGNRARRANSFLQDSLRISNTLAEQLCTEQVPLHHWPSFRNNKDGLGGVQIVTARSGCCCSSHSSNLQPH